MAISTADSLLAVIEKSKLLEPEQLEKVRKAAQGARDARALAKALIKQDLLTRWQAGQLLAGRAAFHLGKYRLMDLLGRGGMGSVFLARHTMMNRPVALKIIAKHLGTSQANLDRFFSEARAVAALNHPNIVHAYSIDNEGERYYMVMEFVEGQDLQRMVEEQGPVDFQHAADYIRQAAEGLAHAHTNDIIHCDIKPANLLVNPQGVVKILDMGMARLIAADGNNGETDEGLLGTVDYMSPELAMRNPDLDPRTDIYSLGCTFYFLLTGHPPFPEGTLAERIVKHQTQQPSAIADQRPDTPSELIEICEKMMAKKPEDRFQSAGEISHLLDDWRLPERPLKSAKPVDGGDDEETAEDTPLVAAEPETADETENAETPRKTRKSWSFDALDQRQKMIVAVAGGVVLLMAVAIGGVWLVSSGEEPAGPEGEIAESVAKEEPEPAAEAQTSIAEVQDVDLESPSTDDLAAAIGLDMDSPEDTPDPRATERETPSEKAAPKPEEEETAAEKPAEEAPGAADAMNTDSADAKPAESNPEEAKAEEKPVEKPGAEKAAEEKPAAEKPAGKKPARKAPPKTGEPLRDVPPAVDLPLIGEQDNAKEPFEIAKVHTAADVEWQLYLLGGEKARGRSRSYALDRVEQAAAKASWTINLEGGASGADDRPVEVARLSRAPGALMFQWSEGVSAGEANYLRNCILQVRVQGNSRYTALCKPKAAEPIAVDIDRGSAKGGFPLKWLPDGEDLRIEITKVEGPEPYQLEPQEPFPPKTPVHLTYIYKDRAQNDHPGPKLRIIFQARASGISADVRVEKPPIFRQWDMALRQLGAAGIDGARDKIMEDQAKIQKELAKARGGPRDRLDAQLRLLDMQLWYVNFYGEMKAGAALHYRIFLPVQDKQVVLASTELAPQPAAAAK